MYVSPAGSGEVEANGVAMGITAFPGFKEFSEGDPPVLLEAVPEDGMVFSRWGGDLSSTTNPVSLKVDCDLVVTAYFSSAPQPTDPDPEPDPEPEPEPDPEPEPEPVNVPPVVSAGPDQAVVEGDTVCLRGASATDSDGEIVSYAWEQTEGSLVTLSDAGLQAPCFVTPSVESGTGTLVFLLTVTDDAGGISEDSVTVSVEDNGASGFPAGSLTFQSANGYYLGIESSNGALISLLPVALDELGSDVANPASGSFPYDLIDLEIKVENPGDQAEIFVHFSDEVPDPFVWYKYDVFSGQWIDMTYAAALGDDRRSVSLVLTDGGDGDDDGLADGIIHDPSGLFAPEASEDPDTAEPDDPAPPTAEEGGSGGGGCFISILAFDRDAVPAL